MHMHTTLPGVVRGVGGKPYLALATFLLYCGLDVSTVYTISFQTMTRWAAQPNASTEGVGL